MGQSLSEFENTQQQAEVLEKLQAMRQMMQEKIQATSDKLENAAKEDGTLPILAIVDKVDKYHVNVASVPSDKITGALNDFISGKFLAGVVSLVSVALDAFLGNVTAGESEKNDFHIIYANNSLLRLDYMLYKYTFKSEGITKDTKSAFCYYFQIGVLDLSKVNPEILLYEITKALVGHIKDGGDENLESRIDQLETDLANLAVLAKKLYSTIRELKEASKEDPINVSAAEKTMLRMETYVADGKRSEVGGANDEDDD